MVVEGVDEVAVGAVLAGVVFPVQGLPAVGVFLPGDLPGVVRGLAKVCRGPAHPAWVTERLVAVIPGRNANKARRIERVTVNKAGRTEPKAGRIAEQRGREGGKTCGKAASRR